jgi:hypothetical protein
MHEFEVPYEVLLAELAEREAKQIGLASYEGFVAAALTAKDNESRPLWPAPLGDAAYHGVVGEFVRKIEPHTEGDSAAILIQALVCFGNALGRGPHFTVEDTRHGTNLFAVIVGDTSKARKGTALDRARKLAMLADPSWGANNDGEGGISSAEGLVHAVRDAISSSRSTDWGVEDKRLLAAMSEFAEMLSRMKREGNPVGATVRNAWDGKTLRIRTRNQPLTATGAHISIIGHITQADLDGLLETADVFNGFGNRFLWVLATRSKELPFGGSLRSEDLKYLAAAVERSILWADEHDRLIDFDRRTRHRWPRLYSELGRNEGGRLGAIVDRAEPQVRRVALVYAAMDRADAVSVEHLEAALEVWRYCEQSAAYLFSDAPAPGVEGRIVQALSRKRGASRGWMSRSELYRKLEGSGVKSYLLGAGLKTLKEQGAVESREVATRGRPRVEYRLNRVKGD